MVANEPIDPRVRLAISLWMELKARKSELFAQVIDGDGGLGSGIDAEDIRRLFD